MRLMKPNYLMKINQQLQASGISSLIFLCFIFASVIMEKI